MADRFVADRPGLLLAMLQEHFASWSRGTLKQRLQLGCVFVNGAPVGRHDHALAPGDAVEIRPKDAGRPVQRVATLPTLFVDDDLVAIDKPSGLLSVSTDEGQDHTALASVRAALAVGGRPAALWPAHRLDRETSGVLLFARSRQVCDAVQADWGNTQKVYLAVVEGRPEPAEGAIDQPLWEDQNLRVRVGAHADAKAARTLYRTRRSARGCSLLEVELETGRKHQIRAHLAWLGHPVVGDERYGTRASRLGLHALRLRLRHPCDGRELVIEAPPPPAFLALLRQP